MRAGCVPLQLWSMPCPGLRNAHEAVHPLLQDHGKWGKLGVVISK